MGSRRMLLGASVRTTRFHFPGGQLDPLRNRLEVDGRGVRLEPKVVDVMAHLLEHAQAVVAKADLMAAVWADTAVSDDALVAAIYALRKALGDDARKPRFIETIPRRGYRWMLPVEREPTEREPAQREAGACGTVGGEPSDGDATRVMRARPDSIGTEVASFERKPGSRRALAAGMLAAACLLMLGGGLLSTRGGATRSASAPNVLVSDRVPDAAEARMIEAQIAYRQGRFLLDRRAFGRAIEHFERAIRHAPDLAEAHASLALAHTQLAEFRPDERLDRYYRARQAAEHALALDPETARAHLALGLVSLLFDWDLEAARQRIVHAANLDPEDASTHQFYAWLLSIEGHHEQAEDAAKHAIALDPTSPSRYTDLAFLLDVAGDSTRALAASDRALALDPSNAAVHTARAYSLYLLGRHDESMRDHLEALRLTGIPGPVAEELRAEFAQGIHGYYRRYLDKLPPDAALVGEAGLLVALDRPREALERLERAVARRDAQALWLAHLPELAPLRDEPRFHRLISRLYAS